MLCILSGWSAPAPGRRGTALISVLLFLPGLAGAITVDDNQNNPFLLPGEEEQAPAMVPPPPKIETDGRIDFGGRFFTDQLEGPGRLRVPGNGPGPGAGSRSILDDLGVPRAPAAPFVPAGDAADGGI